MRIGIVFLFGLVLAGCQSQQDSSEISVVISSIDPSGSLAFKIKNSSEQPVCSSNAGIGTMKGVSPVRVSSGSTKVFPVVYDWFDGDGPKLEKVAIDGHSDADFTINLYEDFSVEEEAKIVATVTVALWDCQTNVPLWTTLKHEETWGPGYLSDS